MIVSWNWLKDYVALDMTPDELTHRFAMSGLNHEETTQTGDDWAIDLEVTSNRPDCLSHIGIAREAAVLYGKELRLPKARPKEIGRRAADSVRVSIECPDLCWHYSARILRGVKIAASPAWLRKRLEAIGMASVNNVVDITNFVLMECGQPLHAFDLAKLAGPEIIVRRSRPGEMFEAINHKTYELPEHTCVIADARRAVALAGVMGGAETEVSNSTTDLLIESAEFAPRSIRATVRVLKLPSDSSFRFERGVDPTGVDWASRRCCELILDIAGGSLEEGVVEAGGRTLERPKIMLRLSQIERVLGIAIPQVQVERILTALGMELHHSDGASLKAAPPTWRRDLEREIDLIEEAARIHGYEAIPEDVPPPMGASRRGDDERVLARIRQALTACGFDEAMTTSVVPAAWVTACRPWTDAEPLRTSVPMLKGADCLRQSLLPSLLEVRRLNESHSNPNIHLFETAHVYLPRPGGLPEQRWMLGLVSEGDFVHVKGAVETAISSLNARVQVTAAPLRLASLDAARSCQVLVEGRPIGIIGEASATLCKQFKLRSSATLAELSLTALRDIAELLPQHREVSQFPAIERDLNFIVAESVRWSDLVELTRATAGDVLESIDFREVFRDPNRDGPGKKRLLFSITLRTAQRTLTGDEAESIHQRICSACKERLNADLVS